MAILFSFLGYTAFAFMDVINKFLFSTNNIPFFSYMFWLDLFIILFIVLYLLLMNKLNINFFKSKNYKGLIIRSILSVGNTLCSLVAISYLAFHEFYTLVFLQPIIASLLAIVFLMEKASYYKIFTIILAFIGVIISIKLWDYNFSISYIGLIGGLGVAITGALSGLVVKKYLPNENSSKIAFYNILLSIIVAIIYLGLSRDNLYIPSNISVWIYLITAGLLACLGMVLFMMSYQKGYIQSISIMQYTQIIWGILFGYLIFSTLPSIYAIIGVVVIIIANIANIYIKNKD